MPCETCSAQQQPPGFGEVRFVVCTMSRVIRVYEVKEEPANAPRARRADHLPA